MKSEWKPYLRAGITLFLLFLAIHYWSVAMNALLVIADTASPLLLGCIIAYLLNILMCVYERYYFPNSKHTAVIKSRRIVCMLASLFTLFGVILFIIRLVIPELLSCIQLLAAEIPVVLNRMIAMMPENEAFIALIPENFDKLAASTDWKELLSNVLKVVSVGVGGVINSVITTVSTLFSTVITILISIIFSFYLLLGKEKLSSQCNRLINNYLPAKTNQKLHILLDTLHDSFHRFIVGQCVEAVILGVLCTIGMLIFRFPYATMIGTLVGFTALIPVAGAYIGAGVGAFMILTVSPMQAIGFLIYIVILQQLEGNLIYPRIVGSSIGLPGIWVLTAVTLGGGIGGIAGMLIGVPLTATAYQLLRMDLHRRENNHIQRKAAGK